jgi:phage-related minor tail protein
MSQTYDLGIRITADGRILTAEVKRSQESVQALGDTAQQVGAQTAAALGNIGKSAETLNTTLNRTGVSAAQTAAALRMVPAQVTDIVTGLASGQAPLTVLIQQGGQLKDAFGGVVPAAKALGGYVAGLASPLTIGAAVAAALGYALYSASSEADEFKRNLILTGNASGLTVDRFNQVTASLDNLSGVTRGAAAEALTTMAASGNIGAESIERLTTAALKMEQAGGPAVAETVKQFEALGKSPAEASLKLNDQTRHLTLAVYEQIKALEAQGKASEAGALAQQAWADAIEQRTPQMLENLGYLQRAWRGIKEGVAEAIDAAKEWGRAETKVEQAIRLQTRIGNIDDSLKDPTRAYEWNRLRQIRQQLKTELDGINADINKAQSAAATAAAKTARDQAQLAANVAADKLIESQRSKREKYAIELKKYDADLAAGLLTETRYLQAKAALAKKYEEKPTAAKRAVADNAYERLLADMRQQLGVAEQLNAEERLSLRLQEQKYARLTPLQKETLQSLAREIDAQRMATAEGKATVAMIEARAKAQQRADQQLADELARATEAVEHYGLTRAEVAARALASIDGQIAAERALNAEIGVGGSEVLRRLEIERAGRAQLLAQLERLAALEADKSAAKAAAEAHKKAAESATAEWQKTVDRIDQTFHDAFVGMLDKGKADWESFSDSLARTFKSAVADEIYKMTVGRIVVNVVGAFGGAPDAAGGAAQAAGAAQQGMGILSGAQSAYAAYTGGITNAASSFAMSGAGEALGLSSTVQLAGPTTTGSALTGTSLTGAGSTFSAVAAPATAALIASYIMLEMSKAGWGPDNSRSGAAEFAANPYLWMAHVVGSRLVGHNRNVSNDASGITGTIDLAGFSGQNYQEQSRKGGTFRGDKRWTEYSDVSSDLDALLDSLVRTTVTGVQKLGSTLGLETEKALAGFSHAFSLQLSDNGDKSKSGEKVVAELGKVSDELATRLLPNIADFQRYGESAGQTLERLSAEFKGTDAILQILGKTAEQAFGAAGIASAQARERLIDYAGGMDGLASKTASFFQHYYSEQERTQKAAEVAQRQINAAFGELGQAVPKNTAEFRNLVTAQDLSTEAGAKLFSQLLDLEGAFYATQQATDAATKAAKAASDTARGQQSGLFERYATDAQKTAAAQSELNSVLGDFGRRVPQTSAEMVRMVQSLDPAIEADQRLLKALDGLTGAFDTVANSATAAADKQIAAMQRVTAQMDLVASYKAGISQAQFDIRSKLPSFDAVGYYSQQGNDLRKQLSAAGSVEQRLGLGDQLKTSILNRYQAEQDAIAKTRDAAKVDFDKRRQDAQALLQLQQQGAQSQQQAVRQWNDAMLRLRDYAGSLLLSDASPLSPEAKLAEAERQYNAMLQRAKGGDADAAGQLQGNAQAYLSAARDYYASGTSYGAIFDQVQSGLASLGNRAQSTASLDAAFQQQSLSYQTQSLALDTQWQQLWADQSNTWQQEDAELAQKTIDELDKLQQQADAWNEELKQQLQEQALNGVRQTELLGDVARNTENLDTRIGAAIAGAMSALQAQVTALTNVQARAATDAEATAQRMIDELTNWSTATRQARW